MEPMIRRLLAAVLPHAGRRRRARAVAHAADDASPRPRCRSMRATTGDPGTPNSRPGADRSRGPRRLGARLLLFGVLFVVGSAIVFGRVLWAGHQRSRASRIP